MIARLVLGAVAATLAAAGVAHAAPARSFTLTAEAPVAKWDGGPASGSGAGVAATRCTPAFYSCDDTLIELKAAGDLTAEIKAGEGSNDLDVAIYKSDAEGTAPGPGDEDAPIAEDISTNQDARATARRLAPGHYVIRVRFYDAIEGVYAGTATLKVPPPPEPPPAAPPVSTPPPASGDDGQAKRKQAQAKCRKKARKIKNRKKRARAMKRCNRKA